MPQRPIKERGVSGITHTVTKENKSLARIISIVLLLAAISCFVGWLGHITPLFADDFSYSVSFVTKKPMSSLSEVLASQKLHYTTTNGRSVVHTLAQLFLSWGKPAADAVYGLLFASLCLLICVYAAGSIKKVRAWHIAMAFSMLWLLTPTFGGSYLWKMGAANYLLSPQIILLFFLPYRMAMAREDCSERKCIGKAAGMLLLGVIAGWTNENTSLALIAMIAAVLIVRRVMKLKSPLWMFGGLIGSCIGAALLFCSPAQAARLSAAGGMGGIADWIYRFLRISYFAVRYFWPLMLIGIALTAVIIIKLRKKQPLRRDALFAGGVFLFGTLAATYSMVGSPFFPIWAWSSILAFMLITLGCLTAAVAKKDAVKPWLRAAVAALALAAVAVSFFRVYPELNRVNEEYTARVEYIEAQKEAGNYDVAVDGIHTDCTYSSYSLFNELAQDNTQWPNTAVANYFGLHSVTLK